MKRMTAEEVAAQLLKTAAAYAGVNNTRSIGDEIAAALVRENLVPQWQGEPTEEGECHVFGIERVCWVYREDTEGQPWAVEFLSTDAGTLATEIRWEPLNGRQVCPIGARPQ